MSAAGGERPAQRQPPTIPGRAGPGRVVRSGQGRPVRRAGATGRRMLAALPSSRGVILPSAASRARSASRPRVCSTADIRRVCRTTVAARGRRNRLYSSTAARSAGPGPRRGPATAASPRPRTPGRRPGPGGAAWRARRRRAAPRRPARPGTRTPGAAAAAPGPPAAPGRSGSVASSSSPIGAGQPANQRRSRASWVAGGSGRGAPAAVATQ